MKEVRAFQINKCLVLVFLVLLGLSASCSNSKYEKKPNIKRIYDRVAKRHDANTTPVIVIPGVLGSNLKDKHTGQSAWGVFYGDYLKPSSTEGLRSLAVKPSLGAPLSSIATSLIPAGVLTDVKFKVLGIPVQARAYANLMQTLGVGGYRDQDLSPYSVNYGGQHFTCFQFSYDWRYSSAYNAKQLDAFIQEKKKLVRKQIKDNYGIDRKDIKFNIIAHSMGGLLARYYARYGTQSVPETGLPQLTWAGAKNINQLIIVSSPNRGSLIALNDLIKGKRFAPKWVTQLTALSLDYYPPELLGTYPAAYELLSRGRDNVLVNQEGEKLDPLSYEVWQSNQWGLADADPDILRAMLGESLSDDELKKIANEHLKKCLRNAKQFQKALDRKVSTKPRDLEIYLYIGDAIDTVQRAKINAKTRELEYIHYEAGDGTVTRSSVLADRHAGTESPPAKLDSSIPYDKVHFIFTEHVQMTEDVAFVDNVLFQLLRN